MRTEAYPWIAYSAAMVLMAALASWCALTLPFAIKPAIPALSAVMCAGMFAVAAVALVNAGLACCVAIQEMRREGNARA